jgi:hypothetical protein
VTASGTSSSGLTRETGWWGAFVIGLSGVILVTGIAPFAVLEDRSAVRGLDVATADFEVARHRAEDLVQGLNGLRTGSGEFGALLAPAGHLPELG